VTLIEQHLLRQKTSPGSGGWGSASFVNFNKVVQKTWLAYLQLKSISSLLAITNACRVTWLVDGDLAL